MIGPCYRSMSESVHGPGYASLKMFEKKLETSKLSLVDVLFDLSVLLGEELEQDRELGQSNEDLTLLGFNCTPVFIYAHKFIRC